MSIPKTLLLSLSVVNIQPVGTVFPGEPVQPSLPAQQPPVGISQGTSRLQVPLNPLSLAPISSAPISSAPMKPCSEHSPSNSDSEHNSDPADEDAGLDLPGLLPPILVADDLPVSPSEDFSSYGDLVQKMA